MNELHKIQPLQFALMRYMPDPATEENIVVGVIGMIPNRNELCYIVKPRMTRIHHLFPSASSEAIHQRVAALKVVLNSLKERLDSIPDGQREELFDKPLDLDAVIRATTLNNDTSLRWSSVKSGATFNLKYTVQAMYERYVGAGSHSKRRDDHQVWQTFKHLFDDAKADIASQKFTNDNYSVTFERCIQNGRATIFEPLSLDYEQEERIDEKVTSWLGKLYRLNDKLRGSEVNFLVGLPTEPSHQERALSNIDTLLKRVGDIVSVNAFIENKDEERLSDKVRETLQHKRASPY